MRFKTMIKNTTELLTILNKNRLIIEELFEKRDRDIYINDISSKPTPLPSNLHF